MSTKQDLYTLQRMDPPNQKAIYPLNSKKSETGIGIPKDWRYYQVRPAAGLQFRRYDENMYEVYIVRNPKFERGTAGLKLFHHLRRSFLACPGIRDAIVVPVQKIGFDYCTTCVALLVELASTEFLYDEQKKDLIEKLWPNVAKTNIYSRTDAFNFEEEYLVGGSTKTVG
ncbi:hypothetical protein SBOR_9456 [Sclerotinia borealis F-4128]|uniref:Uncharacterized protein n=1 Tax=Sclerotinia borealis (strain F-4128) TaxID=1432307 RepID=W9C2N3_SCLBF|nr:hypothetical protein SBOR_9456 [Sclerotinia borealis F-4128]